MTRRSPLALVAMPVLALLWPLLVSRRDGSGGGAHAQEQDPAQEAAADGEAGAEGQGEAVDEDAVTTRGARPLVPLAAEALGGSVIRPRQAPLLVAGEQAIVLLDLMWEPGAGDRIERREVGPPGRAVDPAVRLVQSAAAEIMRPVAARDGAGLLWVVWTQSVDGVAQLMAAHEEGDGFAPPQSLTNGPLANLNPEVVCHADGGLWVAWEGDVVPSTAGAPARHVVRLAPLRADGVLGEPIVVSDGAAGSALDAVVVSSGGALHVGCSEWNGNDYEICVRRFDPRTQELDAAVEVSADRRADDSHPALAAAPDGSLWVAWDRIEVAARGESGPRKVSVRQHDATIDVQVRVACVRGGSVVVPKSTQADVPDGMVAGAPLLTTGGGVPRLALDGAGRVWIAYRYLERREGSRKFGFPVIVQHLEATGWSEPLAVEESVGSGEEPSLIALPDGGVLAAFSRDERAQLRAREKRRIAPKLAAPLAAAGIENSRWNGLVSIGLARAAASGPATFPPLVAPPPSLPARSSASPNDLSDPYVTGARHFEVARGEQRFTVFFGDLHRHSNLSRCSAGLEPGPADRYAQARDVHRCDFFALTDHSGAIGPSDWWLLDKLGWLYASPTFATLLGFEWSTSEWGHHNVILPGRLSLLVSPDAKLADLYARVRKSGAITIPHHPSHNAFPNDFRPVDDRLTRLVEVFQACRGNFEFDGCWRQSTSAGALGGFVQDALNDGHEFGLIASTDHSYGQSYACVLAPALTRGDLFTALAARRTYGATAKGLLIDLRIDDAWMGESLVARGPLHLTLHARAANELADVTIFKDGRVFQSLRQGTTLSQRLAPLRLVAKVAAGSAKRSSDATVHVSAAPAADGSVEANFGTLTELRHTAPKRGVAPSPSWSLDAGVATWRWPAGFAAAAEQRAPLHGWALGSATLIVKFGATTTRVTAQELFATPLRLALDDGGEVVLSIEAEDATLDLTRTLGTRELTREWDDAAPVSGRSWYYARLVTADGEMAWSSPIFVKAP